MSIESALVAGGGIGGLAAAIALARRGVEVDLVEIRPSFDVYGVGLGLPVNALRALRDIGVVDDVLAAGFAYDHFRVNDHHGGLILDHRFRLDDETLPPVSAMPRKALHRILVDAAADAGVALHLGMSVETAAPTADAVEVALSDGSQREFSLLAGFDGILSTTRAHVVGEHVVRNSGFSAWRTTVPRHDSIRCMEFYQGYGSKTGFMPLTEDLMYMFFIGPEPVDARYDPARFRELLTERLAQYGGVVGEVRDALTADDEIVYSPLQPHLVTRPWFKSRIAIGGDAAHGMPPHLTQGAGMALEDAVTLSEEATDPDPIAAGLARYFDRRFDRCAFVGQFARRMLDDEQRIRSEADLEAAVPIIRSQQEERLVLADQAMNRPVLRSDDRIREDQFT